MLLQSGLIANVKLHFLFMFWLPHFRIVYDITDHMGSQDVPSDGKRICYQAVLFGLSGPLNQHDMRGAQCLPQAVLVLSLGSRWSPLKLLNKVILELYLHML